MLKQADRQAASYQEESFYAIYNHRSLLRLADLESLAGNVARKVVAAIKLIRVGYNAP